MMPEPGDPFGGDSTTAVIVLRSAVTDSTEPPTKAKPWPGSNLPVPMFINGCPVVTAVTIPVWNEPTDAHRFGVVYVDNGRQGGPEGTLVVALVSSSGSAGYRVRQKFPGWTTYTGAVLHMCSQAGMPFDVSDAPVAP